MTAEFLATLRERGVRLSVENGRLVCDAPAGVLDENLRVELAARKQELIALIAEAETSLDGPRSLVPLKATGDRLPLFARPGHNGDVFFLRYLADHFDERRPLYGVEPKGIDGASPPTTVEEMAEYEVEQIRQFQPEGPYLIGGYCAGGIVAFESARQLIAAGERVAGLMLIATPFPAAYRVGRATMVARTAKFHASRVRAGSVREGVGYVRGRARKRMAHHLSRPDAATAHRNYVAQVTVEAVTQYDPGYYPGAIDVVFPNEAWRLSGDRAEDWKGVADRVVEHIGPDGCDGDNLLLEPWVSQVAALLNQALDERDPDATHD